MAETGRRNGSREPDRQRRDRRLNEKNGVAITDAHSAAFRRLVVAAVDAKTYEVRDATLQAFHGEPYDLAPIAAKEIDLLLGSAAILDGKLNALDDEKEPCSEENALDRRPRQQQMSTLLDALVRWACISAAKVGQASLNAVLKILRSLPEGSNRLVGTIIGNFPVMMRGTEGLIACLPDFYTAQVGSSPLVRSYAATAMGEMHGTTRDNLPSLAFEAFCAQLSYPYVIVHRAAVRALDYFALPKEYRARAKNAVGLWVMLYAEHQPTEDFLVEAIDLYARCYAGKQAMAGGVGARLGGQFRDGDEELFGQRVERHAPIGARQSVAAWWAPPPRGHGSSQ